MAHLIIDCDTGVDDAMAITIALQWPGVHVEAITCVGGNTSLDNVIRNTVSVLKTNNRTVPIYPGCPYSLLRRKHTVTFWENVESVHGSNGFGDVSIDLSEQDWQIVQKEHAAIALCRLAREQKKKLTLVALAPLTNVAMAMRLDPEFCENLKEMAIMGGNYMGTGSIPGGSEFNFYMDTDAADLVLREANCPITIVPFDCCIASSHIPMAWFDELTSKPNLAPQGCLLRVATKPFKWPCYLSCDGIAMVGALDRSAIVGADSFKYCAVNTESDPDVADSGYGYLLYGDDSEKLLAKSKRLFMANIPPRSLVQIISTEEIKRRIEASLF